jgi:hypothetical protein
MFDQMFRRQQPASIDQYQRELYAKFRILGANIDRLSQVGLAIPELEQLLKQLEKVHDKALVRFITNVAHVHASSQENASSDTSRIKTCPRCTRELTEENIIKDHYSDDFTTFVVLCECGYVKEIRNSRQVASRQSNLNEYLLCKV